MAGPQQPVPTGLPVIGALDVVIGHPLGVAPRPRPTARVDPAPGRALRDALRPALLRPPCVVAFSGGRDSSLLLAVAADLAAREGHLPPVALTFRYPGDPAADESDWQELVIGHLRRTGLPVEWIRREVTTELDNIGPLAGPLLRAHGGPTFPAGIANTILLAQHAVGGTLVTGNAGDEVLGGHRAGVLRAALRRRGRGLAREDWRLVAACVAPGPVRLRWARRRTDPAPWLRPDLRRKALDEAARREAARPLRWDRSVWSALAPRAVAVGARTRVGVASAHGCELVEPLGAVDFVASYAAFGGRWGGLTRAGGTRLLAGGLLPDPIIGRRQKAHFNASRFGPASREFARAWDGRGVDDSMVDPVALRAAWLSELPPASTAMLLQQAWLAWTRRR